MRPSRALSTPGLAIGLLLSLLVLDAAVASALPRYAARYGESCQSCHIDPAGGSIRNLYATTLILPMDLVWKPRAMEELSTFDPRVDERWLLGMDLRTLFLDGEGSSGRIVQMESDLYVDLRLDDRLQAVLDIGQDGTSQAYGLAHWLPAGGTIKVGRFTPAYGWFFADHQRLTRKHLLAREGSNDPAIWEASGLELGLHPARADLSVSVNEGGQLGDSFTARGALRHQLGPVHLSAGAGALRRLRPVGHRRALGVFASAGVRRLSALWQFDEVWENGGRERIVATELDWLVHRGWTVVAGLDYRDPDRRQRSGVERQWTLGVDLLATPHVGATLLGRFHDTDPGPEVGPDRLSVNFVAHLFY